MKLRWKLVALLVVPLAALAGLTVVGVGERLGDARAADRAGDLVVLGRDVRAVGERLAAESALSAWYVATGGSAGDRLVEARAATDASIDALRRRVDGIDPASVSVAFERSLVGLERTLASVPVTRQAVDALGPDAPSTLFLYQQSVARLADVAGQVAEAADGTVVATRLTGTAALLRAAAAQADVLAVVGQSIAADRVSPEAWTAVREAAATESMQRSIFLALASPELRQAERQVLGGRAFEVATAARDRVLSLPPDQPVSLDRSGWADTVVAVLDAYPALGSAADTAALALVAAETAAARRDMVAYALIAAATVLFALLTVSIAGRAITTPLGRLVRAARRLADEDLPRLVDALRDPDRDVEAPAELAPVLPGPRRDEIGELASAFDAVQRTAVEVATEQASVVRQGISELFVNLARRNQSLLDRQIAFLDQLEADEADPDALAQLFTLDHLATRMRRNAESLLVLAGVEPSRRWGQPLPLEDVVRAAIGEVEAYGRIQVLGLDAAGVAGQAVADVAHLLAELLDNATQFSPPDTPVEILGRHKGDGYCVAVSDYGIGMSAEKLAQANAELANPAVKGLALSRTLGFTVVGLLAARHGISVELSPTAVGGVTATVTLPAALLAAGAVEQTSPVPNEVSAAGRRRVRGEVPAAVWERLRQESPEWESEVSRGEPVLASRPVASLAEAVPPPTELDRALQVLSGDAPARVTERRPTLVPVPPIAERADADAVPERQEPAMTPAGLPRRRAAPRTPDPAAVLALKGSFAPPTGPAASYDPPAAVTVLPRRVRGQQPGGTPPGVPAAGAAPSNRSPDEIRSLLSSYRSGLHRGRTAPVEET